MGGGGQNEETPASQQSSSSYSEKKGMDGLVFPSYLKDEEDLPNTVERQIKMEMDNYAQLIISSN